MTHPLLLPYLHPPSWIKKRKKRERLSIPQMGGMTMLVLMQTRWLKKNKMTITAQSPSLTPTSSTAVLFISTVTYYSPTAKTSALSVGTKQKQKEMTKKAKKKVKKMKKAGKQQEQPWGKCHEPS
jgi:hypothetical protein